MNERAKPSRRRKPEARPAEILRAAYAEFTQKGFAGASIVGIAQRAGISHGTIYNYYRDKEEIFRALVASELSTPLDAPPDALGAVGTTSEARMRYGLRFAFRSLVASEGLAIARILIAEADRFPDLMLECWAVVFEKAAIILRAEIDAGIEAGEFVPGPWRDDPLPLLAPGIVSALFGSASGNADWVAEGERRIDVFLDCVFAGVRR